MRAGHADYVINDAALAYMREHNLAGPVIAQLAAHSCQVTHASQHFADAAAWAAHLECLGIARPAVTPDPVKIATEAALWGAIKAHGFLCNSVIPSDDAGQFDVGHHALCWVHPCAEKVAERLVHKLHAFTDHNRQAQEVRGLVWGLYRDLLGYKRQLTASGALDLRLRFDAIFRQRTGFAMLDRLLKRLHANRSELLVVLDRPEIPLHTNGSENDIRCQVLGCQSHQAKNQRRHQKRHRPRLPRRIPRTAQDLRQARRRLLGLSRCQA